MKFSIAIKMIEDNGKKPIKEGFAYSSIAAPTNMKQLKWILQWLQLDPMKEMPRGKSLGGDSRDNGLLHCSLTIFVTLVSLGSR